MNNDDNEDASKRKWRKKRGGNSRKNYEDGWVEFMDKKIARMVATSLNNTQIGGTKKNRYREDIWNLRYLPKFKWDNLTGQFGMFLRSVFFWGGVICNYSLIMI